MPIEVVKSVRLWSGGYALAGTMNALAVDDSVNLVEATVMTDAAVRRLAGLRDVVLALEGYMDSSVIDAALFAEIGAVDTPVTFSPDGGAEGAIGYGLRAAASTYSPSGEVGAMFAFSYNAQASAGDALVRGEIGLNATLTTTGNRTGRQLGAVAAGQSLYASLHVLSAAGSSPTLDAIVESDDADGFASPTTRIAFSQATAIGAQWGAPAAGAIADDWYRFGLTIGGGSPSFLAVGFIGIE